MLLLVHLVNLKIKIVPILAVLPRNLPNFYITKLVISFFQLYRVTYNARHNLLLLYGAEFIAQTNYKLLLLTGMVGLSHLMSCELFRLLIIED